MNSPEFKAKLRGMLKLHEGVVPWAYQDSLGYWTIYCGHLIDKRKGGRIPDHIGEALLDYDIDVHRKELILQLPWVAELDDVRQAAMIDMYFNLRGNLLGFRETLRLIQAKAWSAAADAMLDSKWATQVGDRATELSAMIRTGKWQ